MQGQHLDAPRAEGRGPRPQVPLPGVAREQDAVRIEDATGLAERHHGASEEPLTGRGRVVDEADEDVRRLDELSKPLDEMAEDLVNTQFFDRMEDEEDGNDSTESGETPSTETTKE